MPAPVGGPRLDAGSVIVVGERAAGSSGTFSAVHRLASRTGARVVWVPRRAGDRGAVDAGCLPYLLPGGRPVADPSARVDTQTVWGLGSRPGAALLDSLPAMVGRDADEMLISAADGELAALLVAGVEPNDFADPQAALDGLESVGFVVSLETRASAVTERADVVLPVSLIQERAGTFLTWEGRQRYFDAVLPQPNAMSDLRVLAALADGLGVDLGVRTPAQARAELAELGTWEGERSMAPDYPAAQATPRSGRRVVLATWRLALDDSRALDGEPFLQATARPPVARLSPRTAAEAGLGGQVVVSNDRGSLTVPVVVDDAMVDGVVWLPQRAPGHQVPEHLAAVAGDLVTITAPPVPAPSDPALSETGAEEAAS